MTPGKIYLMRAIVSFVVAGLLITFVIIRNNSSSQEEPATQLVSKKTQVEQWSLDNCRVGTTEEQLDSLYREGCKKRALENWNQVIVTHGSMLCYHWRQYQYYMSKGHLTPIDIGLTQSSVDSVRNRHQVAYTVSRHELGHRWEHVYWPHTTSYGLMSHMTLKSFDDFYYHDQDINMIWGWCPDKKYLWFETTKWSYETNVKVRYVTDYKDAIQAAQSFELNQGAPPYFLNLNFHEEISRTRWRTSSGLIIEERRIAPHSQYYGGVRSKTYLINDLNIRAVWDYFN